MTILSQTVENLYLSGTVMSAISDIRLSDITDISSLSDSLSDLFYLKNQTSSSAELSNEFQKYKTYDNIISDLSNDGYLTKTSADATYQTKGNYVSTSLSVAGHALTSNVTASDISTAIGLHNSQITIVQGGIAKGMFTLNQDNDMTLSVDSLSIPSDYKTYDNTVLSLSNDGYVVSNDLNNYLDKRISGAVSGDVSIEKSNLSVLSGDIVQTGGVFTCGSGAQAFGENSFATGDDSHAGARGWYYKAVDTTAQKIYLTLTQHNSADIKFGSDIGQISPDKQFSVDDSIVGKRICLVDKNKDDFGSTVVAQVENGTVLVYSGQLVNKNVVSVDSLDYDDYSVIISEAPDAGLIDRISKNAFANGKNVIAAGRESHAEGRDTFVQGNYSHAEGRNTKALAYVTHAEGIDTIAGLYGTTGSYSHAEGNGVSAIGYTSHAEGYKTMASGPTSHSEGNSTEAQGEASHAEGYKTTASGNYSHAEGGFGTSSGGFATGQGSHAEGMLTLASGIVAHAEGNQTQASASGAHTEGQKTIAAGNYSHAEGNATSAMTEYSHAEGNGSVVSGLWSHTEGYQTSALGNYSHAEGRWTVAGKAKNGSVAATYAAHAEGFGTKALGIASLAAGVSVDVPDDYAFGWNGVQTMSYASHGASTFNINPQNGLYGFYVGKDNFIQCVLSAVSLMNTTQLNALKSILGI